MHELLANLQDRTHIVRLRTADRLSDEQRQRGGPVLVDLDQQLDDLLVQIQQQMAEAMHRSVDDGRYLTYEPRELELAEQRLATMLGGRDRYLSFVAGMKINGKQTNHLIYCGYADAPQVMALCEQRARLAQRRASLLGETR